MQWLVIGISGVTCGGKTTLAHALRDYFQSLRNAQLWNTPYTICDVQMISQDDYFLPVDDMRHKWNDKLNVINFELLSSLDMKQMLSDITWTMEGRFLPADAMDNINDMNNINSMNNMDYINKMSMSTDFKHFASPAPAYIMNYFTNHQHMNSSRHGGGGGGGVGSHATSQPAHIMRINSQMDNKIGVLILEGFMLYNQPELLTLCNIKFHFHLPYEKCYERRQKRTYEPPDVTGYFEICVWPHYEKNFAEFRDRKDITFLNGELSKERIFRYAVGKIITYFEERCDVACPPPHKMLGIPGCSNANMPNLCTMDQ